MNKQDLAIATMSLARDSEEENLLRKSLTHLSKLNIPIFLTDGGSNSSFLEYVSTLPNITLLDPKKGLWNQTLNSLTAAYENDSKFILYTEPDKSDFFEKSLHLLLENIQVDETTGIIMAARSTDGFHSFPLFQQMTETTINNCCKELIGLEADYVYGPFILNRTLIPYLKPLEASIGWGWRPFTFHLARRVGLNVSAYTGDFFCPESQRDDSTKERIYRMKQMNQNIDGLILAGSALIL